MRRLPPLLLLLLAGGCAESASASGLLLLPEELASVTPGSRLRPARLVPDEGPATTFPSSLIDAELGICSLLELTDDGVPRCMPGGPMFVLHGGEPVFSDPECVEPFAPARSCSGEYTFTIPFAFVDFVPTRAHAFRAPAAEPVTPGPLWERPGVTGACTARTESRPPRYLSSPVVRAERIPEAAMVELIDEARRELGGPLVEVTRLYADGTVARARELTEPCWLWDVEGQLRCLPGLVAGPPLAFEDAACTQPTLAVLNAPLGAPVTLTDAEGQPREVRRVVEVAAMRPLFVTGPAGCEPTLANQAALLGGPETLDAAPVLRRVNAGTSRLRPVRYVDEGGQAWPTSRVDGRPAWGLGRDLHHDAALELDCYAVRTFEGYRCLPAMTYPVVDGESPAWSTLFADAACTDPLLAVERDTPTHVAVFETRGEGCDAETSVASVWELEAYEGATFRADEGRCEPTAGAARAFQPTASVELSAFVGLRYER